VPLIDATAIILPIAVALGQVELGDARLGIGENLCADRPAQRREIGFLRAFARDQDEVGGIDRADGLERQLIGIAATDPDQRQGKHGIIGRGHPRQEFRQELGQDLTRRDAIGG